MPTKMKRFTLTVTPEMEVYLDELKRTEFYNKSCAEMYRYILDTGLNIIESDKQNMQCKPAKTTA